ncbi:DUF1566 domain-containing protein [Catenovulum maritimum]|uniref:Lcl C-terminal domain-containing protein n=1 Tax=Catenovulum maritimum TaxID=1513271 RepID=A0A0J8GSI0_9ALTE|nr:DUF1566 domain-containing protein [Catenovulum maritimum]KMT65755.1 hypothetical protein XM47_07040 [Catenovulum maritimum]
MKKFKNYKLAVSFSLISTLMNQNALAFCTDSIAPSITESNYILDDVNGVVTDGLTGLMWSRCNYGEVWSSNSMTCTGTAKSAVWIDAVKFAAESQYASHSDWRLPNVKELMGLIERQCAEPATNINLFASTKNQTYWTSTPVFNLEKVNMVWGVQFKEGTNSQRPKGTNTLFRLVRKVTN